MRDHAAPSGAEVRPRRVAFVSMPFHRSVMPPIALGILKSALAASGIGSVVYNLNLDLLPELDDSIDAALEHDVWLSNHVERGDLVGEWLFSPPDPDKDERYIDLLRVRGFGPERLALLRRLRARVDTYVAKWAQRVAGGGHDIVGFSSTFGRIRASVRLSEAIRQLAPGTRFLLGGAGSNTGMALAILEAFPVLDVVCHAEADDLIVSLVRALRGESGFSLDAVPGITYRRGAELVTQPSASVPPEIERTPLPDYDDYVEDVRALRSVWADLQDLPVWLPLETARGCWWGTRDRCTFCSFTSDRMVFRAKSTERVLRDVAALSSRYGLKRFLLVDNILSNEYFQTLLPRLADERRGYRFWWEVRPSPDREKAAAMARAGIFHAYLGVESLCTPVLRLMHKGTTGIGNVSAIKWLTAYGVQCSWNFLFSLPGERFEWYEEIARVIPRLMHLPAPRGPLRVGVERFSPLYAGARELGVQILGPTAYARLAFADVKPELLERFTFQFEHAFEGRAPDLDARILDLLTPLFLRWRESVDTRGCTLSIVDGPDESLLVEGPLLAPDRMLRVRGLLRRFLKGCESIRSERLLLAELAEDHPAAVAADPPLSAKAYARLLAELCATGGRIEDGPDVNLEDVVAVADARGWIYREGDRILSLPVDRSRYVGTGAFELEAALRRYQ